MTAMKALENQNACGDGVKHRQKQTENRDVWKVVHHPVIEYCRPIIQKHQNSPCSECCGSERSDAGKN